MTKNASQGLKVGGEAAAATLPPICVAPQKKDLANLHDNVCISKLIFTFVPEKEIRTHVAADV
jgi:hypothetical protein